ncbi:MAG: calcium-binding protein [Primorskyibacter sp.]
MSTFYELSSLDDFFTSYNPLTDGQATQYEFTSYVLTVPLGYLDGLDDVPVFEKVTSVVYGSDDLVLRFQEEDDGLTYWYVEEGTLYALQYDGQVPYGMSDVESSGWNVDKDDDGLFLASFLLKPDLSYALILSELYDTGVPFDLEGMTLDQVDAFFVANNATDYSSGLVDFSTSLATATLVDSVPDVYQDDPDAQSTFTPYDETIHGPATAYTFSGFEDTNFDADSPASADLAPFSVTFYGSDDLRFLLDYTPYIGVGSESAGTHELHVAQGDWFSVTFNGEPIPEEWSVDVAFMDLSGATPSGSTGVVSIVAYPEDDSGDGLSATVYAYGPKIEDQDVPSASGLLAVATAIETGVMSVVFAEDGTIVNLAGLEHVSTALTTDVPEPPVSDDDPQTLHEFIQSDATYEDFAETYTAVNLDDLPLITFTSDLESRDDSVAADLSFDPEYHDVIQDFADAIDDLGETYSLRLYDFEPAEPGNFAGGASSYTPAVGQVVEHQSGAMADGTAAGTLYYDHLAAFHLFMTGAAGGPDDPGIADHSGNDADRGYNVTPGLDNGHYLEVLPSETDGGGLAVHFAEATYGFGFHLMGREEDKRDVYLDIYLSDGSMSRVLTDAHPTNTGGEQYYAYMIDMEDAGDGGTAADDTLTIEGFVLYEDIGIFDTSTARDIFAIDDLVVVTDAEAGGLTASDLMNATAQPEEVDLPVVQGDDLSNTLQGSAADELILGHDGYDWILPGGGDDVIDGGAGRDMLSLVNFGYVPDAPDNQFRFFVDMQEGVAEGLNGHETIEFDSIERLTTTIYADLVRGTDGDDDIRTKGHYDWIIATDGNDTYNGGTGRDMVTFQDYPGSSNDTKGTEAIFDGPDAIVSVPTGPSFEYFYGHPPSAYDLEGVTISLADPGLNSGWAAGKTYIDIERFTGSSYQDVFYGDDTSNNFRGLGGNDWFVGSAGGRERYFGGNGQDTVTYYFSNGPITASLNNGAVVDGEQSGYGSKGDARRDLYFSIENLVGTTFGDTLTGNNDRNELSGLDGDDMIFALGGNDLIRAGDGYDTVDGGAGSDTAILYGDRDDYILERTGVKSVTISKIDPYDITDSEGTVLGSGYTSVSEYENVEYFEFWDTTVDVWSLDLA